MSSLQIAEITGKRHDAVLRDIREILVQAEIGLHKFEGSYRNAQNKEQPCYNLPRRECDLVVSGYSVKYRLGIIDRWQELEAKQQFTIPQSFPEALRLAADLKEKLDEQSGKLEEAAPKIEFHDRVTASNDVLDMAAAVRLAKLPFGRNTLLNKLREAGVLMTGGRRHNLPLQRFISHGLFTVNESVYEDSKGEKHVTLTTNVTQKGVAWLIRKFG